MNARTVFGLAATAALAAASARADVPAVTKVNVTAEGPSVVVTYELTDAPAIVTLNVETNNGAGGWASIGGGNIRNFAPESAVFRRVEGTGPHTITWHSDLSWPGHRLAAGDVRLKLAAWPVDAPPDYMVVDLSATAATNSQAYYPSEDYLPGGLMGNPDYRTSKLVMRRMHAKDVTWSMGSTNIPSSYDPGGKHWNIVRAMSRHNVKLPSDYFIGVFPVTQSQWALVVGSAKGTYANEAFKAMRPVDTTTYNDIRNYGNGYADYNWPNDPYKNSFLGKIRPKTGIDFELPTDAQWEFACRAGTGDNVWNDGTPFGDVTVDANLPGRYKWNGGYIDGTTEPPAGCTDEHATAAVGSYGRNAWGLYDMHGNVREWCLDYYDETYTPANGIVNIDPKDGSKKANGTDGGSRVVRGGSFGDDAFNCRPAYREGATPSYGNKLCGFRVACPIGLVNP